jgi:hypothetical protein
MTALAGSCECGVCAFTVKRPPKARFICHCTLCQTFTGQPFSDVTMVRAADVTLVNTNQIVFRTYRPPPNIRRGACRRCAKPAIEVAGAGPAKIMFIPARNFARQDLLPAPQMRIFYGKRIAGARDDLPRHEGYWPSQFAVVRLMMRGL